MGFGLGLGFGFGFGFGFGLGFEPEQLHLNVGALLLHREPASKVRPVWPTSADQAADWPRL